MFCHGTALRQSVLQYLDFISNIISVINHKETGIHSTVERTSHAQKCNINSAGKQMKEQTNTGNLTESQNFTFLVSSLEFLER